MIKTKKQFSNFDVFAIAKELNITLSNATISNVYQVEDLLVLKLTTKQGKKNLIIKNDSRINLTDYDYPIPKFPSQYIMSLRKFLKNRRIFNVSQHNFDRIVIMELSNTNTAPWKFVIELFNKGNFLLLDENNTLKIAKKYKKFRDRDILANREYFFPKSRGIDFLTMNEEQFIDLFKNSDEEVVRHLARNVNIAGVYSEEICFRAHIEKKTLGKDLTEEDNLRFFESFKKLRNNLLFGEINAQIILDNNREISVIPFEIEMYESYEKKAYSSFNEAVDEFYSKIDSESIMSPNDQIVKQKIETQEKILKNQIEYLETLRHKKKKYYEQGDFIYANFNSLEKLINVILNAKAKGHIWSEINSKLRDAKNNAMEGTSFFEKIIPSTRELIIKINDDSVVLDLRKSIGENANLIYGKGKKAGKKIDGTIPAMEKTKKKIEKLKLEKESIEAVVDFLIKKPKKKWYEKFRWFISSDDFLVIGGRDASSNEVVFKKYVDENDLVFHTIFPGSPLTVIKNPDNIEIPDKTIKEAADFVASYSRAWKENWGVADVYFVRPAQVSKSPPSGEFLPKGSFVISGKKNIIKNAQTRLAIGLEFVKLESKREDITEILYPKLICGPRSAIKKRVKKMIVIIPSKTGLTKGKLAKKIKAYYINNSEKDKKKWINLLNLDEINLSLPTGNSEIKSN